MKVSMVPGKQELYTSTFSASQLIVNDKQNTNKSIISISFTSLEKAVFWGGDVAFTEGNTLPCSSFKSSSSSTLVCCMYAVSF